MAPRDRCGVNPTEPPPRPCSWLNAAVGRSPLSPTWKPHPGLHLSMAETKGTGAGCGPLPTTATSPLLRQHKTGSPAGRHAPVSGRLVCTMPRVIDPGPNWAQGPGSSSPSRGLFSHLHWCRGEQSHACAVLLSPPLPRTHPPGPLMSPCPSSFLEGKGPNTCPKPLGCKVEATRAWGPTQPCSEVKH